MRYEQMTFLFQPSVTLWQLVLIQFCQRIILLALLFLDFNTFHLRLCIYEPRFHPRQLKLNHNYHFRPYKLTWMNFRNLKQNGSHWAIIWDLASFSINILNTYPNLLLAKVNHQLLLRCMFIVVSSLYDYIAYDAITLLWSMDFTYYVYYFVYYYYV